MNLSDAYKYTSKIMSDNVLKEDAIEGINAFIEKRKPNGRIIMRIFKLSNM